MQEGVYEIDLGVAAIRVIVAGRLPQAEPNALLHLFSASEPLLEYGRRTCRIRSPETSTLVLDLFKGYRVEGLTVPITMEEYIREAKKRLVQDCTVAERLEGIPPEQRLEGIPPEQLVEKLLQEGKVARTAPPKCWRNCGNSSGSRPPLDRTMSPVRDPA